MVLQTYIGEGVNVMQRGYCGCDRAVDPSTELLFRHFLFMHRIMTRFKVISKLPLCHLAICDVV